VAITAGALGFVLAVAATVTDQKTIAALGIDHTGQKHALGVWDGSTENAAVCQSLLPICRVVACALTAACW
jgi:hypothetical protein